MVRRHILIGMGIRRGLRGIKPVLKHFMASQLHRKHPSSVGALAHRIHSMHLSGSGAVRREPEQEQARAQNAVARRIKPLKFNY